MLEKASAARQFLSPYKIAEDSELEVVSSGIIGKFSETTYFQRLIDLLFPMIRQCIEILKRLGIDSRETCFS